MKIHEVAQKSVEWMILRAGIPTASELDNLVTPKFEIRKGQMPASYLASKIAEWWQGGPLAGFNVFDMDQGNTLEEEAIPWYELEFEEKITRVGFITTDDGRVGCSPDGLLGNDGGIEIKCPTPQVHTKYLLAGHVPDDYLAQVHGAMYVTGRAWWKFLSYRRLFPKLLLTVMRDEEIQEKIGEALEGWLDNFELAKKRIEHCNGGPKPAPKPSSFYDAQLNKRKDPDWVTDQNDVPTP